MSKKYQKTRRKYSYKEKLNILKKYKRSGDNMATFARNIRVPPRTLQNWYSKREEIFSREKKIFKQTKNGFR